MKLPEKIKIAGIDVNVIDWDHHSANAANCNGIFSKEENCMKIDTTHNSLRVTETFLHELLHGIWAGYHLDDEDKEERIVATFAAGLTQVFRDNPEVMKLLKGVLTQ